MRSFLALSIFYLVTMAGAAQVNYFPAGSLSPDPQADEFCAKWYGSELAILQEPSLWGSSRTEQTQSYRFLWLRTFHRPLAIRLDVNADGTSRLTTKMASGTVGFHPGKLVENTTVSLDKEKTDRFLRKIDEYKFWQLQSVQDAGGNDGAEWIIEGIKDGSYHVVSRWSPDSGPVRAIGLLMVEDLAKLKIPPAETY